MELGWHIFIHSVRQVLNNLGPALRISVLPLIIILINATFLVSSFSDLSLDQVHQSPASYMFRFVLSLIITMSLYFWLAVAWHRFVLLEEQPGAFSPHFNGTAFWAYVRASLLIILAAFVIALIATFTIVTIVAALMKSGRIADIVGMLVLTIIVSVLILRISPILPAAAVSKKITISESWHATAGASFPIAVVGILLALLSIVPSILSGSFLAPIVNNLIFDVCAQWLMLMLGISVATTLYGHFVEKRDLI